MYDIANYLQRDDKESITRVYRGFCIEFHS